MRSKRMPLMITAGLILFTVSGCGASASKKAAEATAGKYFQALGQKDWDAALSLYGAEFFQKIPKEEWRATLAAVAKKLGDYRSRKLEGWNYQTYVGTGGSRQVNVLTYHVRYDKGEATEVFTIVSRGEAEGPTIAGHQINSPGLLALEK